MRSKCKGSVRSTVQGETIQTDRIVALGAIGPVRGLTLTDESGTLSLKVQSVSKDQIQVDGTVAYVSREDVYL